MPCHNNLEDYLTAYIDGCELRAQSKVPLFRTIARGTKRLSDTPLPQANAFAMVRRRAVAAEIGTAIMRIGENSRTVASAVAERLDGINASLPTDVVIQPVLDRTALVNSTIKTVAKNLTEGALLVIVVLFVLLGNFRAALIAALVIPITMAMTTFGLWRGGDRQ